ncbi:putative reverse transcriptase domain-containing protein [Tanacetum coccineum]
MLPRMRTRSAGRPAAESLGGGTGERVGKGGRGRRPREGNDERVENFNGQENDQGMRANGGNLLPAMLAQVSNRGNVGNQNGNVVNENVQENVGNEIANGNRVGCSYKEFLACNPKEYDVPHLVTPESRMIERYAYGLAPQISGMVEAMEPKTIQKAVKDKNGRDDNKRTRTGNVFATTVNPVGRENTGHLAKDYRGVLRNVNTVNARNPTVRACYKCSSTDHIRSACPRLNRAQEQEGNRLNQVAANNEGQVRGNQGNQARGRAFMLGAGEARQDPNIMTGLKPISLGFRYEIEIASGQLVEIDKVIKGCKLEIEGHVFYIDLIPFGHGSFDVIIGMDWLSNYKAEIICHEKVVRIPLPDGKVLRVVGERPKEKARLLMSTKASDKKQEEIVVVRDFPEVFLDDLSGLPPIQEIKFRIELIPGGTPVAKSPYRLAPSELEELSGQLKELWCTDIKEMDKNKEKIGQNRARD